MKKIISLTGCSSCGKNTILEAVLRVNPNINPIISTTSRPMREGEIEGKDYHFKTYQEVKSMLEKNEFIEHRVYNIKADEEWIYGIHNSELEDNNDTKIVIVDYQGLISLHNYCSINNIELISYYIECHPRIRLARSLERQSKAGIREIYEMCRRLIDDEKNVTPAKNICKVLKNEDNKDFVDTVIEISKVGDEKNNGTEI